MKVRHVQRGDSAPIMVGGVAGAVTRWAASRAATPSDGGWFAYAPNTSVTFVPGFPTSTLLVNLAGCLLLGALTVLLARPVSAGRRRVLVGLATGVCGSLTTLSGFAVEAAELFGSGSAVATPATAVVYVLVTIVGAGLAFALGRSAVQRFGR